MYGILFDKNGISQSESPLKFQMILLLHLEINEVRGENLDEYEVQNGLIFRNYLYLFMQSPINGTYLFILKIKYKNNKIHFINNREYIFVDLGQSVYLKEKTYI